MAACMATRTPAWQTGVVDIRWIVPCTTQLGALVVVLEGLRRPVAAERVCGSGGAPERIPEVQLIVKRRVGLR